jgi:hypothetical protein
VKRPVQVLHWRQGRLVFGDGMLAIVPTGRSKREAFVGRQARHAEPILPGMAFVRYRRRRPFSADVDYVSVFENGVPMTTLFKEVRP